MPFNNDALASVREVGSMQCPECGSAKITTDRHFDVFCQNCGTVMGEPVFA